MSVFSEFLTRLMRKAPCLQTGDISGLCDYVVFSRYTNELRIFELRGTQYQELILREQRFWFSELELGLGLWQGSYQGVDGFWMRWYDATNNWIPTPMELAEVERQQHQLAEQRVEQLTARLRDLGVNPEEL